VGLEELSDLIGAPARGCRRLVEQASPHARRSNASRPRSIPSLTVRVSPTGPHQSSMTSPDARRQPRAGPLVGAIGFRTGDLDSRYPPWRLSSRDYDFSDGE
jgi:hypothetical protein